MCSAAEAVVTSHQFRSSIFFIIKTDQMAKVFILLTLMLLGAFAEVDPVDKLQEFQKLMQSKVKVPKKNAMDYDSSDIFSDGYTTEEVIDLGSEDSDGRDAEIQSEQIEPSLEEEEDEDYEKEATSIKQAQHLMLEEQRRAEEEKRRKFEEEERLQEEERKQQQYLEQQKQLLKEQKRKDREQQKLKELEQKQMEQRLIDEVKSKKKLIKVTEWSDDESELFPKSAAPAPSGKGKGKKPVAEEEDSEEQILKLLKDSARKKKKLTLEQLEEIEFQQKEVEEQPRPKQGKSAQKNGNLYPGVLEGVGQTGTTSGKPARNPKQTRDGPPSFSSPIPPQASKTQLPPSSEYEYDSYYDLSDSASYDGDEEFIQKVPVQNQTFIKFNNPNNKLELAPCSNNPTQQRSCSLCKTEVGYQLDDDNWYMIGLQHGYKKEFLTLLDQTKQLLGDTQLYLSFSSNNHICLTSDSLKQEVDVESVLQRFADRSLKHFVRSEQFSFPMRLEGQDFQFKATYGNKQFQFTDFEIRFKTALEFQRGLIKVNQIVFQQDQLQITFRGQAQELPFEMRLKQGEMESELLVQNCSIPTHTELVLGLSDLYFGEQFKEALKQKLEHQSFKADLVVTSDQSEGKLKIKFSLRKR